MSLILTNQSTNATISIKVIPGITFANVKQCAMSLLDSGNCLLKYVDCDGDEVTIASDVDLVEALSFMKEAGMESMNVLVKPNRSFPPTLMQQQVLNMVAAVGAFAKQVETDILTETKTNPPSVKEVFERMHHAVSEWHVSEHAKAIQFLKPDLLEVLSSAQLIQTIELLSTTTQYAPLVNAVLQTVSTQEPIESVLVAHWEDVVDFTHEVLKQCQEVALRMLLIRIAKTCAAGVAEYNKHASPSKEMSDGEEQMEEKDKQNEECNVIHVSYRCDGCQTIPIVGPRFRSIQDADFDLCGTCHTSGTYDILGPFETITVYLPIHYGIICDGCEMSPIVGIRYKSFATNNFDLCETCEAKEMFSTHEPFIKIKHPDQAPGRIQVVDVNVGEAPIIHPFVVCDGCEMSPIIGKRFKSTTSDDFDLCGKCHSTGTWNGSHGPFAEVERPSELHSWKRGTCDNSKTDGHHPEHSRGRHYRIPIRAPDSFTVGDVKVASDASVVLNPPQQQSQPFACRSFIPAQERDHAEPLSAAFEGDVTIPDGTVVAPDAELMKAWKVKNNGERAWPEGCMLKMQTGRFGFIPFEGDFALMNVAVPRLSPGEEFEVGVQLRAPTQAGRYRAYWRMCDPDGVCFGHRFWIDLVVSEDVIVPVEAAKAAIDNVASVAELDHVIDESTSSDAEAAVDGSDASTVELELQAASSSESEGSSFFDVESDGSQSCDDVESVSSEAGSLSETSDESEDEQPSTVQQPILVETEMDEANLKELYEDALSVLEAMGFGDKEQNRHVLSELGGNLMDAINNLLLD